MVKLGDLNYVEGNTFLSHLQHPGFESRALLLLKTVSVKLIGIFHTLWVFSGCPGLLLQSKHMVKG